MATTLRSTTPRRPRWRSLWLAASAGVALLLGADLLPARATPEPGVSAALLPGYEIVENITNNVTLQPGESFSTFNTCPGKLLIGGGVSLSLEPTGGGVPSLISNSPTIAEQWVVEYINLGTAPTTFGVRVTAVCATLPVSRELVRATNADPIAPGQAASLEISCPRGTRPLSGGNRIAGVAKPFALLTNSSHGQGWVTRWINQGSRSEGSSSELTAFCIDPRAVPTTTFTPNQSQLQLVNLAPGENTIKEFDCSGSPLNGGITVWDVSPNATPKLAVVEDGPIPPSGVGQTRWRFRLLNFGTTPLRVQYLVNATCIS